MLMDETYTASQLQEHEMKIYLSEQLVQSGEKERLKEMLRLELVQCGWHEEMKQLCKDVIRNKGIECVTVEELIEAIVPRGRASVPEAVKSATLEKIKTFVANEINDNEATTTSGRKKNGQQLVDVDDGATD
uniref:Transcription and mRNA export factor ENY2 n=1 Tax=Peronospora matthiolae TaxID=2874970 RepID=A0AAV1USK1_9STRA